MYSVKNENILKNHSGKSRNSHQVKNLKRKLIESVERQFSSLIKDHFQSAIRRNLLEAKRRDSLEKCRRESTLIRLTSEFKESVKASLAFVGKFSLKRAFKLQSKPLGST